MYGMNMVLPTSSLKTEKTDHYRQREQDSAKIIRIADWKRSNNKRNTRKKNKVEKCAPDSGQDHFAELIAMAID